MSSKFPRQIHKAHYSLRSINELAYEPLLLSIGPYHHQMKERYEDMEKFKELCLQKVINRRNRYFSFKITSARLEMEMKNMEFEIRKCYASSYRTFGSEEFCRMMVLDGCFVIEILRRLNHDSATLDIDDDDKSDLSGIPCIWVQVYRDLLLFENQLPIFVLERLFQLTKEPEDGDFIDLVLRKLLRGQESNRNVIHEESPHLLGLAYATIIGQVTLPNPSPSDNKSKAFEIIRSATELHEAGVRFKVNNKANLGTVKFENGTLEIPYLMIDDHTESEIRNYVAYEQYSEMGSHHLFTDYAIFLDCLINTPKDVELLRHAGIIFNNLGDDVKVSEMFNRLSPSVSYNDTNFYYVHQFCGLNSFCARRRNLWMAKLRRNYFNSPWSLFSFLAALALLVLTFIQAIFSVLQYVNP